MQYIIKRCLFYNKRRHSNIIITFITRNEIGKTLVRIVKKATTIARKYIKKRNRNKESKQCNCFIYRPIHNIIIKKRYKKIQR